MSENKDLWTPWEWKEFIHGAPNEEPQGTTIMSCGGHYICHQFNIRPSDKRQELASAIVSAVNNTYGCGINPEAVPDLLRALKFVRDAPQFKRMDWKLKVTIDAAIDKAKLI
jgi:hypothetical protein